MIVVLCNYIFNKYYCYIVDSKDLVNFVEINKLRGVIKLSSFRSLSETELRLMEVIWEMGRPVKSSELLTVFSQEGKEWKGQTISTFLSRLVEKGVLIIERQGRPNTYVPRISYKEYKRLEAKSILDELYQGSIRSFIATLYEGEVTQEDLEQVYKWFSDK